MDATKQQVSSPTTSKQHHLLSTSTSVVSSSAAASTCGGSTSQLQGECPEGGASGTGSGLQRQASNGRSSKHATPSSSSAGMSLNLSNGTGVGRVNCSNKSTKNCLSNGVDQPKVVIKREPDSLETHRQCSRSPTASSVNGRRLSLTGKDGKKSQRLSTSQKTNCVRSFSLSTSGDDLEDDLKLSAADCMGGVISTPPIKPLEEGDDLTITTPSPPTSAGLLSSSKSSGSVGSRNGSSTENHSTSFSAAATTSHSTSLLTSASHVTSPTNNVQADLTKKPAGGVVNSSNSTNASLMQELDDFSKILDEVEVAMEQKANEERYQRTTDAFHGTQAHETTPHVPRPSHLPPPYYPASAASKPGAQQYYGPAGQQHPYNGGAPSLTHGTSSVRDPALYIGVDYQHSLQQRHMTSTQVDPTTFAPRPDQLQPHHLSGGSPQVHAQPPPLGQTRPALVSPTVRLPLPHTPISSHMPPFPDPVVSSVTTPTMPPHTPTTPLEHFSTFPGPHQHPAPPSQIHSPTHPQYVPPPGGGGAPISSTAFSFAGHKVMQDQLRSPTVTSASFSWQGGNSLRDQMLAQVKSQIETRIGGQKRQSQEAGFPIPPPTKMVATGSAHYPQIAGHSHMTMRPPTPQQQQQQYLPPAPPTGSGGPVGYTGLSQQQPQQLVRSISYQTPGGQMTSAPAYPHHHI